METRKIIGIFLITVAVAVGFSLLGLDGSQFFGNIQVAYGNSTTATSTVTVTSTVPSISVVHISQSSTPDPANLTLVANATTAISVITSITDYNGCTDLTNGTATIILYRVGESSSTCSGLGGSNLTNCYIATGTFSAVFPTNSCSGQTVSATSSPFGVYYFAQGTDSNSPYPSTNWVATVYVNTTNQRTANLDSTHSTSSNIMSTLTAISVGSSSINYGTVAAAATSSNIGVAVSDVGNSSTSLQVDAAPTLSLNGLGVTNLATSSQEYSSSSATFLWEVGTSLTGSLATLGAFTLTAPTSTTAVLGTTYWMIQIASGTASGSYSGVNGFASLYHA